MRAAVLQGPGDVRVEELPVPECRHHELVARVSHCGICGTDLHMMMDGWGRPGSTGGHEWSGIVAAVGADVTDFEAGDRIVGGPARVCGHCPGCAAGRPSLCHTRDVTAQDDRSGAFAEYVRIDARSAVRIPPELDLRHAALAEPLAVALHAVTQATRPYRVRERSRMRTDRQPERISDRGPRVLVSGAGPIGTLTVAALRARGVDDITVSEPRPVRQRLASKLGASVVDPSDLEQISIAEPHRIVDQPFDAVIECSGKAEAAATGLCQLARGGTLVLVGTGMAPLAFDPNRILLNELDITGAFEYDEGGFAEALSLLSSGAVPADVLVEPDDVGLDAMVGALSGLTNGDIAGKVLVAPAPQPLEVA